MPGPERVALVTGASTGIGFHTALGLARAGFHVIVAGRDLDRTTRACQTIAKRTGSQAMTTALADFASLADVRRLAETVLAEHDRLDVLVNNAGLFATRYALTGDGIETTIAVNHLAPFLLTNLLLERLKQSAQEDLSAGLRPAARLITVASQAHRNARLNVSELAQPGGWTSLGAYGRSKLCNVLFTRALARRLDGTGVVASCLHPGVVATGIGDRGSWVIRLGWNLMKPLMVTPEQGAATSVFLATVPDPARFHGAYVIGRRVVEPDLAARNDELGERLWAESARLVGLPEER
jgi:NAD(P)-dependent dehydrogenase (short-subunit alcohol dehydrogenase family)